MNDESYSQEKSPEKSEEKVQEKTYSSAYYRLKRRAESYFIDEIFKSALPLYLQLNQTNPSDPEINYKIGVCYLHSEFKNRAIPYFEKAKLKDKEHQYSDIDYYLGVSFHYDHQFDKAIEAYSKYKSLLDSSSAYGSQVIPVVEKYIQNCETGKILVSNPIKATVQHLNTNINSVYSETSPIISSDETTLFFSSQKHESTGGHIDDETDEFYEDIYYSKKVHGRWTPAKHLGTINSFKHDAPLSISKDGKKLFLYISDKNNSTDIYYTEFNGIDWTEPKTMGLGINSPFNETGAAISADGNTFYFSSDRPGGYGKNDLYYCTLINDSTWSAPANVGPKVNTHHNEEFPHLLEDGITLYFSADGPSSIGGLDIFKTVFNTKDSSWAPPVNIGYPINTAEHEFHVSWSPDGKRGYISTYRRETYGEEDIFFVEVQDPEPEKKIFAVADTGGLQKKLAKPKIGQILEQKAYFDYNIYSQVAEYSEDALGKVTAILDEYKDLKVEIGGHTDAKGSVAINQRISEKRAKAVYQYLLAHGVDSSRMAVKGYNFTKLIVDGKNSIENAVNRRVEFKILTDAEYLQLKEENAKKIQLQSNRNKVIKKTSPNSSQNNTVVKKREINKNTEQVKK